MDFRKLPSNSECLLLKLTCSENPTQTLQAQYKGLSAQQEQELDGIIRELTELGYINVKWADNEPYLVILNNSARMYSKQLSAYSTNKTISVAQEEKTRNTIFISHRSTDKFIADMLLDFFTGTGIPKETVFCSSLPGNDVNERISKEIKSALKSSAVNISILSHDYYQSAYCLNEAGILWYEDVPVILIALPEINSNNMYGFLNNDFKLRQLDSDIDISYIYDTVSEAVSAPHTKTSLITHENKKLRTRYAEYLKARKLPPNDFDASTADAIAEITTDDERIVLYYILQENVRKVSRSIVSNWLNNCEIRGVNIDNAFDLLSSFSNGALNNDTLELGIDVFRKYSANAAQILPSLKKCVEQHTKLAVNTFEKIWTDNTLNTNIRLFVAYMVDEKTRSFGDRWMAEGEIENIRKWESQNTLDSILSSNYESCLDFFIQSELVYASSWTSYGNPREYTLYPSLQNFLSNCPQKIMVELQKIKDTYHLDFPF